MAGPIKRQNVFLKHCLWLQYYMNVAGHNAGHSKTVLKGQVNVSQAEFERIALAQVTELWTNYRQLGEIWFDGGYGGDVGPAIKKLIQKQKLAVGFGGSGVMDSPVGWVGTESGLPGGREIWTGKGPGGWMPIACDTTLQTGDTWFIEPEMGIRTLQDLTNVYHQTVGRNGVLEMDFAIDRTGRVAPKHAARYKEFGAWVKSCYDTPVASAAVVGDGGGVYNISISQASMVDRVVIREDIAHGQRVRGWTLAAEVAGEWVPTPYEWGDLKNSSGTGVGNRFVAVFTKAVKTTALRLTITAAVAEPMLSQFAAFAPGPCALPAGLL